MYQVERRVSPVTVSGAWRRRSADQVDQMLYTRASSDTAVKRDRVATSRQAQRGQTLARLESLATAALGHFPACGCRLSVPRRSGSMAEVSLRPMSLRPGGGGSGSNPFAKFGKGAAPAKAAKVSR